ncbi:MAG: serine O-acetyltransferase [Actinomycetota bacterium]|nr:serine O-acetyltransferase [Actinomycetota bacterium]
MASAARPEVPAPRADRAPFLDALAAERRAYALPPQLRELAARFAHGVLELLFPHFTGEVVCRAAQVQSEHATLHALLVEALHLPGIGPRDRERVADLLFADLPAIRAALLLDAQATYDGDPAAHSVDEVILAYPGFFATAVYRIAHRLHRVGVPLFPRLLTELAHRETGIDIHPGAEIGPSFAVDHGTGVVVGETAVLGAHVRLYQGVTLGAASVSKRLQHTKRHPTIGDDVVIYANATILGGDTVIGKGSRIGGNVWLTRSLPPHSVVTAGAGIDRRRGGVDGSDGGDDLLEFNI